VLGELIPIRVPRGESLREVRTSITFVFALLLMAVTIYFVAFPPAEDDNDA